MHTSPEAFSSSVEPDNTEIKLHQIDVQNLLSMTTEDREQVLSGFTGFNEAFSLSQVQELWGRRDELDKKIFDLMINSVLGEYNGLGQEPKYLDTCPFTGLQADATVSGWYPSWLDECAIDINSSIAKELVNLAQRVGAGVDSLTIRNQDEILFDWGSSFYDDSDKEFVNNIGALGGIKTLGELDVYEREAVEASLTDEARRLVRSAVNEVFKTCSDQYRTIQAIQNEITTFVKK